MKNLIIYFSRAEENYAVGYVEIGNTQIAVNHLKEVTNAKIFRAVPIVKYPAAYNDALPVAKERQETHNAPIIERLDSIDEYDIIYIASPIYHDYLPEEVVTAIKDLDFTGKEVRFLITHEGSKLGSIPKQINEICKNAIIKDGLAIYGSKVKESFNEIDEWINSL